MAAGATDNGKPSVRLYYDPRYYAGNVFDPDGYSLEFVFKSWQHQAAQKRLDDRFHETSSLGTGDFTGAAQKGVK